MLFRNKHHVPYDISLRGRRTREFSPPLGTLAGFLALDTLLAFVVVFGFAAPPVAAEAEAAAAVGGFGPDFVLSAAVGGLVDFAEALLGCVVFSSVFILCPVLSFLGGEENVEDDWASDAESSVSGSVEDLLVDFFWPGFGSGFFTCSVLVVLAAGGDLEADVEPWASDNEPSVSGSREDVFSDFFLAGFGSSFPVLAVLGIGGDFEVSSTSSLVCWSLEAPSPNFVPPASFRRFSASFLTSASSFLSTANLPQTNAHFSKSTALTPSPSLSLKVLTPFQSMPYSFLSYLIFRFHPPCAPSQHTQRKSSSEKNGALSPSRIESNRLAVAGPTPFNSSSFFKGAVKFVASDLYRAKADFVVDSTTSSEFCAMSPGSEGRLVPCILIQFSVSKFTISEALGHWENLVRGEHSFQSIAQVRSFLVMLVRSGTSGSSS